jgi:hypothetical protein
MTFAALPYVKSFYGALYDRLFGGLEKKWIAEVQPRAAEEIMDEVQQQDQAEGLNHFGENMNGQILMEIDLELQVGMGDDDEPPEGQALPAAENQNGADQGAQDGQAQGQNAGQNNGLGLGRRPNEIIHDTGNLDDTCLPCYLGIHGWTSEVHPTQVLDHSVISPRTQSARASTDSMGSQCGWRMYVCVA